MTIADYLKKYSNINIVIREILMAVLKKEAAFLISQADKKLSKTEQVKINKLIEKYKDNWPLAYITNKASFYHLSLKVNSKVLIPRPETELMIDLILNEIEKKDERIKIIDLGTGSGAIILSLADILKDNKKISFIGTDISPLALKVAKENRKSLNLDSLVKLLKSDLLNFLKPNSKNLIIAANLPYLKKSQLNEKSIEKEPQLALNGAYAGLAIYKKLLKQLKTKNISNFSLYLEINPGQEAKLIQIIQKNWPKAKVIIKKDLNKNIRFLITKFLN